MNGPRLAHGADLLAASLLIVGLLTLIVLGAHYGGPWLFGLVTG